MDASGLHITLLERRLEDFRLRSLSLGQVRTSKTSKTCCEESSSPIQATKWPTSTPNKANPESSAPSNGTSSKMERTWMLVKAGTYTLRWPRWFGQLCLGLAILKKISNLQSNRITVIIQDDSCARKSVTGPTTTVNLRLLQRRPKSSEALSSNSNQCTSPPSLPIRNGIPTSVRTLEKPGSWFRSQGANVISSVAGILAKLKGRR